VASIDGRFFTTARCVSTADGGELTDGGSGLSDVVRELAVVRGELIHEDCEGQAVVEQPTAYVRVDAARGCAFVDRVCEDAAVGCAKAAVAYTNAAVLDRPSASAGRNGATSCALAAVVWEAAAVVCDSFATGREGTAVL
jgi:hypothetical protein